MDMLLYILAGAGVGLAVGMTGVGGGSLMTPLLVLFGFPLHVAIGTDLLYAAATKTGGMFAHHKKGTVEWKLVALLAIGSIPASLVTTLMLQTIYSDASEYESLLSVSLGVMLILTSLVLFSRHGTGAQGAHYTGNTSAWLSEHAKTVTLVTGVALGIFVTLSSVGAGAFCAAILLLTYPRLPALHVVGTDIAHAVPLTLIAGIGHWLLLGNVDFALLGALLLGSLPAIWIGSHLGGKLPDNFLQLILAFILMLLGIKFVFLAD